MKLNQLTFFATFILMSMLSIPAAAQQKQTAKKSGMSGMEMDMTTMMQSPQHKLMTGYMKSMSAFASSLVEQTTKAQSVDIETARATVAEIRHNLDAMEALHQKHMQSMSAEMQSKMQMMMQKMDQDRAMLKDQVGALETDVQSDKPNVLQLRNHANALVNHLTMMSNMHGSSKAGKKTTSAKMDMKKM